MLKDAKKFPQAGPPWHGKKDSYKVQSQVDFLTNSRINLNTLHYLGDRDRQKLGRPEGSE